MTVWFRRSSGLTFLFIEEGEYLQWRSADPRIADFFNVKKFPGKRGIHTWPNALIEMALYG